MISKLLLNSSLLLLFLSKGYCQNVLWADRVVDYSSEVEDKYNSPRWKALQVLGKPNVMPQGGASSSAWAPKKEQCGKQFIHVRFDGAMQIKQVAIAENTGCGAIIGLTLIDDQGNEYKIKTSQKPESRQNSRWFRLMIPLTSYKVADVIVHLNTNIVKGWNQIDAIAISDSDIPVEAKINIVPGGENFKLERLSYRINSSSDEIKPLISPDGQKMYLVRDGHPDNLGDKKNNDIWVSQMGPEGWKHLIRERPPLNNIDNNYVIGISADGNKLLLGNIYGSGVNKGKGLSMSHFKNLKWQFPRALNIINYYNNSSSLEATISSDFKTIIMSVDRNGGFGSKDLYVCFEQENNQWSEPKNIGPAVNTASTETAPFLAADRKTLYYSSNGMSGYGHQDIYMTERLDDSWTKWSEPVNMGPIVNSKRWNAYLSVDPKGEYAYLSKADKSKANASNIFKFSLKVTPQVPTKVPTKASTQVPTQVPSPELPQVIPQGMQLIELVLDGLGNPEAQLKYKGINDPQIAGIAYPTLKDRKYVVHFIAKMGGEYELDLTAPGYKDINYTLNVGSFTRWRFIMQRGEGPNPFKGNALKPVYKPNTPEVLADPRPYNSVMVDADLPEYKALWKAELVDFNTHRQGLDDTTFSESQKPLNARRYYQFGRGLVTEKDGSKSLLRRIYDFETGKFFDLKQSNHRFPRRHSDTLNATSRSNGEFVHYANDVSTYICRKTVNYGTKDYYFVQYNHRTDTWSDLIYLGPCNPLQYLRKLTYDMQDNYFYYSHAKQDKKIQPDSNYAPLYESTRYDIERLDLRNFKVEKMFTLHMPKREKPLHFEEQLITPDGKKLVLIEYDDFAYNKAAPNDPPSVVYIIDVETHEYKTVEIPLAPYGNFITPDSKYLIVGGFLEGTILKIDLEEAKVIKKVIGTKTAYDFYMVASGKYFAITYNYEKLPRKVVDFRSCEDLSLIRSMQLETLFGKGAKFDNYRHGLYGGPLISRQLKLPGDNTKGLPVLNYMPDMLAAPDPNSSQAIALAKAESIAKAKQYIKDSKAEYTIEKHKPKNLKVASFDKEGNVLISGSRYMPEETTATVIAKLSPEGKLLWETKLPYKTGATSTSGFHFMLKDGSCLMFTRYYHNFSSIGCARISRISSSGKIIYDYKFIRQPNPGHKDVTWDQIIFKEDGTMKLKGISYVERKQFGQNDYRNLYRPWTGEMSPKGKFTDTTVKIEEGQEKNRLKELGWW